MVLVRSARLPADGVSKVFAYLPLEAKGTEGSDSDPSG